MSTLQLSPIAQLNDRFRQGDHTLGQVRTTQCVNGLSSTDQQELFRLIRTFDDFTEDNDLHGEHNFGIIEFQGEMYFWTICYHTPDLLYGSTAPKGEAITTRFLTVMHSSEHQIFC